MTSTPTFHISSLILSLISEIQRLFGRLEGLESRPILPELRRGLRILTLHASCAIEGNSLSLEQVRTIIAGQPVLAPVKDVLEIQNANKLYEMAIHLSPSSERDFLRAHQFFQDQWFSRKDYMGLIKNISTATASRDLSEGIELNELTRSGDKVKARYLFI